MALVIALASAQPAYSDALRVVTDIPPVHSLVARVMEGAGEPVLILPPGASPHGYAMRPSEAAALSGARVVFWIGEELTPWLRRAVEALAPDAASLELLDVEGTLLLAYREGTSFTHHAQTGEEHERGRTGGEREHGTESDERDQANGEHVHGARDAHAWLDPENARIWLDAIATELAKIDPANADIYTRNAEQGRIEIDALVLELTGMLAPVRHRPFIVFHDGYHYFEHRFGVEASGAISLGDASSPSPARIAEIRETLRRLDACCVFAERQFPSDLIETVVEDTPARTATLDPLGVAQTPGPALYPELMRALARDLRGCLGAAP
jgi:zinc transport system substrate-binding protein